MAARGAPRWRGGVLPAGEGEGDVRAVGDDVLDQDDTGGHALHEIERNWWGLKRGRGPAFPLALDPRSSTHRYAPNGAS